MNRKLNERFLVLQEAMSRVSGVDIFKKDRRREVVNARVIIAGILYSENYRYDEIAEALNKNRSTIYHYIKKFECFKYRGYKKERELLDMFNDELNKIEKNTQ